MGAACGSPGQSSTIAGTPQFFYFPIAGRGELIRLIAAAGGVEMAESTDMKNMGSKELAETGESKALYLSPSGMPLLSHGDLKISQSGAIESYIADIAPRYSSMTVQQRAVDRMYQGIKEEILFNCAKAMFTTKKTDEEQAKKDIIELFDKWFAIFEERVPDGGFIQGLGFPTPADLALLNITTGYMPFGAATKFAGYDIDKWQKVKALCARTKADPAVAKYFDSTPTTAANPFGM